VTSVPPPPPDATGAETGVEQYHAVCTAADVASCVPACNAEHHGFELLATIDGTDTKFSCNLAHGLYSWMGAASEGGYLGADIGSFFSAVNSGAAGSYFVGIAQQIYMDAAMTIKIGQVVKMHGSLTASAVCTDCRFVVRSSGSLDMRNLELDGYQSNQFLVGSSGNIFATRFTSDDSWIVTGEPSYPWNDDYHITLNIGRPDTPRGARNAEISEYAQFAVIYNAGHLAIQQTSFTGLKFGPHISGGDGGCIHNRGVLTLLGCSFVNTEAFSVGNFHGAAIYNDQGNMTVHDSDFRQNKILVTSTGSADGMAAGAIFNSRGWIEISASIFEGNVVQTGAGAIGNMEGVLRISDTGFSGNEAGACPPAVFGWDQPCVSNTGGG
jgi:hypothetical protein